MSANGYTECRGHAGEDYSLTVTIEGDGSIASGWTFAGRLWAPDGTEIENAVVVEVTDAEAREITATIAGQSLEATAYYQSYRFEVRRTDEGARTVVAWGTLELTDPGATNGPPLN